MPYSEKQIAEWADPTAADLADPLFEAIWQATKSWDVNVPEHYVGYCGMNGNHVMLILNALRPLIAAVRKETREECEKDAKRYQWLRSNDRLLNITIEQFWPRCCTLHDELADEAIDAAIRNLQEREEG